MNDAKIVSLSKRRGFIFQSSEIYGGLKSAYDFGPLGVELKRNIAQEWWKRTVHEREDVVGIDAAIFMHSDVWRASGHLAGFSDPLVDCHNCKERFRADKAPTVSPGTQISWKKGGKNSGEEIKGTAGEVGYVCPACGSSDLSNERQFNLMFRTSLGPVDPFETLLQEIEAKLRANGIEALRLDRQLSPPWTTDWMSESGREKLRGCGDVFLGDLDGVRIRCTAI